jgi:hypothetical protein
MHRLKGPGFPLYKRMPCPYLPTETALFAVARALDDGRGRTEPRPWSLKEHAATRSATASASLEYEWGFESAGAVPAGPPARNQACRQR